MASRRRGREMALQVLCMLERQPDLSVEQALRLFFVHLAGHDFDEETAPSPPRRGADESLARDLENEATEKRFAEDLVRGVRHQAAAIDALLGRCSRNWRLERMSWVDRNLLRLACFELDERRETPARVVLNEAIEIARRYSTSESSGFVNGVLDRVMQELGHKSEAKSPSLSTAARGRDKEHAADPR